MGGCDGFDVGEGEDRRRLVDDRRRDLTRDDATEQTVRFDRAGSVTTRGAHRLRVEVLETSRCDAGVVDEIVDVVEAQTDHPTKLIGRKVAFVNEAIKRAKVDAQIEGGFLGA